MRDLLLGSRIFEAASRAGADLVRVDSPADLLPPGEVDLVLVDWGDRSPDWGDRSPDWGEALSAWCALAPDSPGPRLILFGPHTDLEAHADARAAGLGPMWARSKLVTALPELLADAPLKGSARG